MDKYCWVRPGAVGDILATLNLAKRFADTHKGAKLTYLVHPSLAPIVSKTILKMGFSRVALTTEDNRNFGWLIPLVGYPIFDNPPHPIKPMSRHLIQHFAEELHIQPDYKSFILPKPQSPMLTDYITIHVKAGWSPYKNWPIHKWEELCLKLKEKGLSVIQIGGPSDPGIKSAVGRIAVTPGTESQQAGVLFETCLAAMANARLHVGVDSWSNHATNIMWDGKKRTKGVILWGSTDHKVLGYLTNHNISLGSGACSKWPCYKEDPKISDTPGGICGNPANQTYEDPKHICLTEVSVDHVFNAIMMEL